MRLPDWITWPRMDWRARVILRWWLLFQIFAGLAAMSTWAERTTFENFAALLGFPLLSLWVPLLLAFVASSPRAPSGDSIMRPLLVGTLTVVLWTAQIVVILLLLVFAGRLVMGY